MMIRLAALLLGCAGDKPGDAPDSDDPIDTVPACATSITAQPEIRGSDPLFPLSRAVTIALSAPARLELTATDETGEEVRWVSPAALAHDLPLVGLHADGSWTLDVRAIDDAANCSVDANPVAFSTDPLPVPLPGIDVLVAQPEAMAPGLTLVPIYTKDIAYIAYLDDAGRIVWLYGPTPDKFTEVRVLPSGNLLALTDIDVTEIDAMGVVRVWASASSPTPGGIPVAIPSWHHDVLWSSRETIVALSKETIEVDDFPLSEEDVTVRGPAEVAQDVIVEFDDDGTVLEQWYVTDMLDLERLGYDSLTFGQEGLEWAHVNAVEEDVVNSRWILSARNQDAVFAVSQADSRDVQWILGNHDNWHLPYRDKLLEPVGTPFEWPYHQHACKYDPATGRVLLFDNGNFRASPWTDQAPTPPAQSYSRIVEYTVDEVNMEVTQNWDFRLQPDVFSFAMGDADWLDNGNVLGDFAYVEWIGGEESETLGRGNNSVRVVEFEPLTGEVVWDIDIWSPLSDEPNAWQAYRTQRIARLHAP